MTEDLITLPKKTLNQALAGLESANIYLTALRKIVKSDTNNVNDLKIIAIEAMLHASDNDELSEEIITR